MTFTIISQLKNFIYNHVQLKFLFFNFKAIVLFSQYSVEFQIFPFSNNVWSSIAEMCMCVCLYIYFISYTITRDILSHPNHKDSLTIKSGNFKVSNLIN